MTEIAVPEKPWWQSRGIIGSLVTVAASLVGIAGYTLDIPMTTELIVSLITLASGILSWVGRAKASKVISKTQVFPNLTLSSER